MRFFLGYGLIFLSQHILTVVAVTAILFVIDWRLALIALAITPVLVGVATRYCHVSHPVLTDVQQRLADVTTVAEETIVGVRVVKAFAQEEREAERFRGRTEAIFSQRPRDAAARRSTCRCSRSCRCSRWPRCCSSAAAPWSPAASRSATSSPSTSTARCWSSRCACSACGSARPSARSPAGERIFEVLDEPEDIRRAPGAVALPPGGGRIALRGRHVRLRRRPPRARGRRPRRRAGQRRRADRPDRLRQDDAGRARAALLRRAGGRVLVDGVDVRDLPLADLRRAVGVVSEDPFLFSTTVRENIAFGAPSATDERRRARGARRPRRTSSSRRSPTASTRRRRARPHALGRPAPADRDRARAARRPAHPDPRRRDGVGRRDDRGAHPARRCAR